MKKLLNFALVTVMICSLAGCSGGSSGSTDTQASSTSTVAPESTASTEKPSEQDTTLAGEYPAIPDDGEEYNIILAYSGTNETTSGKSALQFKELVEANSNGKITVSLYDNNQLGSETETIEGVQAGNITMSIVATSPQVTFIPELAVFDLPNALTDLDAAYEVLESGDFRDQINAAYDKAGFYLAGITPTAFRQMTSNIPVHSFEDFNGIRIRTMENKYHMAYWSALGTSPTPLAFNELYMGLQQGLVDAQENPLNSIISTKLFEQQKYVIKTNHIMFIYCYFMNKDFYEALPSEYQQVINIAINTTTANVLAESKQAEIDAEQTLKDSGLEIIEVPDDMLAQMVEAAQGAYDMVRADIGDELVDALLSGMEAASR